MTARIHGLLAGACIAALAAGAAWAQAPAATRTEEAQPVQTAQLGRTRDVVVVTATRTEEDIDDVPATVSVITAEDIEDQLATDIKDLVRFEPGVSVRNSPSRPGAALGTSGRDGNSGFNIRGLEGNRVLIQTDGIRLPDAFSFGAQSVGRGDYVDLEMLKRVEIVRGPASALYGSDGLAGAVSFTTKDPEDLIRAGQSYGVRGRVAYADADGSWSESAAAAFMAGSWSALLFYTHRDAHEQENMGTNYALNSTRTAPNPTDISSDSVLGKIVFAPSDTHRFRLTGEHFESDLVSEVYTNRAAPPLAATSVIDLDIADTTQRDRVSFDYTYEGDGAGLIDSGFAAIYYQESQTVQFADEDRNTAVDRTRLNTFDNDVWGLTGQVESGFTTGQVQHTVVFGGDYSSTRQEGIRDGTVPSPPDVFPTRAFPNTDYVLAGLFVQDEISFADGRVLLYPALRFDAYDLQPELDALYPAGAPPVAGQDDTHLSPKFGAVVWATDHIGFFGNYAAGFKAPTPTQVNQAFFNPTGNYTSIANPDLKPETSDSFEGGVRLRDLSLGGADISASATAFTAQYENFIEQVTVSGNFAPPPAPPTVFQFVNLSDVDISGAEARVDAVWANGLGFIASASYAKGDQTTNGVEAPLQSIDPWKAVAAVTYDDPQGRFGGQFIVTHSGGKENQRVAENVTGNAAPDLFTPPNFTVFDLTAYVNVTEFVTLRAGAFNITGEKYWWWGDVRGVLATSALLDAYTQPGRNYSVSVTARF